MNQKHLNYQDTTQMGSYYTPPKYIDFLFNMLKKEVNNFGDYVIIDTSCGYGSILVSESLLAKGQMPIDKLRIIGADIDEKAIEIARQKNPNISYYVENAIINISRDKYNISADEKLIIVGNPPYNDITSQERKKLKEGKTCDIDPSIKRRDLGMSFMLSYEILKADYVCVLHPFSYLIKKTNYKAMKPFLDKYKLIDNVVVDSAEFEKTSKKGGFPIIIALYEKNSIGTSYETIMTMNYNLPESFSAQRGGENPLRGFNLNFDTIVNYIDKYPKKREQAPDSLVGGQGGGLRVKGLCPFWAMRDINALRRNRTFVEEANEYTVVIEDRGKMPYYCYVDVFKEYVEKVPYFLRNCDVMIDREAFLRVKEHFIARSIEKHPFIAEHFSEEERNFRYDKEVIDGYFRELLEKITQ